MSARVEVADVHVTTGAKAIIQSLEKNEVKVIFGIPGGATLPIYDELVNSSIRHILVRHEQCGCHMADGFARASGDVGVCFATSGPGATNLVTGIANAHMDSSPIVAVTGQVARPLIGKDAFQEADIIGICGPITKHSFQVTEAKTIPEIVKEAFYIARSGRPGPVLIDVPIDVQRETVDRFRGESGFFRYRPKLEGHPLQIKRAAELLMKAEKPMILAGGGVIGGNASTELKSLAEFLIAPVATSLMGKGSFPEDHPLSLGVIGMHGRPAANYLVNECDALFAIGIRFSDRTTAWKLGEFAKNAKIIHADIDPAEIEKNVKIHIPIVGDARTILKAILERLKQSARKKENTAWRKRIREIKASFDTKIRIQGSLKVPAILKLLRRCLPRNGIVATEVGQNQMWTEHFFEIYESRTFISSGGLGTMGFGFPASLGAKVAKPDQIVVDIAGDGSFLMTQHDLATSVSEGIPIIVCILNNSVLGMVAQWQRLFYGRRYSAVQLKRIPDFVKLAQSYGAEGVRPSTYKEIETALKKAMKNEVTTVLDIWIDPEENVLPMVPPGEGITSIRFGG